MNKLILFTLIALGCATKLFAGCGCGGGGRRPVRPVRPGVTQVKPGVTQARPGVTQVIGR